ncbi:hypothetical protein LUZ60_011252 [Juncus effusus]|nr:hypothetical protein LUZ60_011252 [Juncus effusus]
MAVLRPPPFLLRRPLISLSQSLTAARARSTNTRRLKQPSASRTRTTSTRLEESAGVERLKRRTRSDVELDLDLLRRYGDPSTSPHVPVLLCEVLHAFRSVHLRSFVDCTLGAAGHSSAMIEAHEEMEFYVGMDVDPTTHNMARTRIESLIEDKGRSTSLRAYTRATNFKNIKHVLHNPSESLNEIGLNDSGLISNFSGVDGILIDLGISSMQVDCSKRGFSVLQDGPLDMRMDPQADLRAEDILNGWPESEIGRILRDYGEESNWRNLQRQIIKARCTGGLHSTSELVELVRKNSSLSAGRQGWIKTATRVFQALRIAVNNELENLEDALYSCFDCLAPGGRLAVISFHSLEDRIVKQTFLNLINRGQSDDDCDGYDCDDDGRKGENEMEEEDERWYKSRVEGRNGTILTKRPISPSVQEEKLNPRCRSAKLRIVSKSFV